MLAPRDPALEEGVIRARETTCAATLFAGSHVTVTKVPGHGSHLAWLYVEAVRRRWSLSVAAAKPALRIVDPRRG